MGIVMLLLLTAVQIGESVYGRLTSDNPQVPETGAAARSRSWA